MRHGFLGLVPAMAILIIVLMAPVSAAAAYPYTTTVERNRCETTGGANGHGFVRLKVLQKEWGTSGTNYFKVRIQVQQRLRGGGSWTVVDSMTNVTESFPNDSNSISLEQNRRYDFTLAEVTNYAHRIAMRFQWWDMRAGPDVLLSQKTVYSSVC